MKRVAIIAGLVGCAVIAGVVAGGLFLTRQIAIALPEFPLVTKSVWLEQNWSTGQRAFYHHALQGSTTFGIPYEWVTSLERPELSLGSPGLLTDTAYLDRYGFIPSDTPDPLPIGFEYGIPMVNPTTHSHWTNPQTGRDMTTIGLTCSACHVGRMTYKGTEIYIDGGAAKIDVNALRKALAVSLYMTRYLPGRFDRFAERLLGRDPRPEAKAALSTQLDGVLAGYVSVGKLEEKIAPLSVPEGIGRLDALNRIGNQVFGLGLGIDANYWPTTSPVRFPQIWGSPRFDWVEWNSSIQQPMMRNAGEAMGLGAKVDFTSKPKPTFASNIVLGNIYAIEATLRGPEEGTQATGIAGLRSPKWPAAILPPIDAAKARKGAALYKELCQSCHLPPVGSADYFDPKLRENFGPHALILPFIPVTTIGTDPAQSEGMANRTVETPPDLGITTTAFGVALAQIVQKTVAKWYDSQTPPTSPEMREIMNGQLPSGVRTPIAYKARPLDGIWSVSPYLHNGSVPTLYALLSPLAERPKAFTIGSREFDPVDVGLRTDAMEGGTAIDTSIRGDRNTGHEFDDGPARQGVIGRKLSEEERRDLVEYLKTL